MNWWLTIVIIVPFLTSCGDDTLYVDYYPNGQIKEQRRYLPQEDRGEGNYTFQQYSESGKLLVEGHMVAGEPHGEQTEYFPNGKVSRVGNYRSGTKFGLFEKYFEDGQLQSRRSYSYAGVPESSIEIYDEIGRVLVKGQLSSGTPTGPWSYCYHGADWKQEHILYDSDGVTRYKKIHLVRHDPGYYEFTAFRRNGIVDSTGAFRGQLREGEWKYFYTSYDSIKSAGSFFEDHKQGEWTYFRLDGGTQSQGEYDHGVRVGIWTVFDSDQAIKQEDRYENGEKFLENYWDTGKQTVKNGRGYVDRIVYDLSLIHI